VRRKRLRPGRRFRLLLYERLYDLLYWPLLLSLFALAVLWWYAPFIPSVATRENLIVFVGGLCLLLFLITYLGRFVSFVQCHPNHLRIQTPIFRLAISYQRIKTVRPVTFREQYPVDRQRWSQRRFIGPLLGLTGVGVTVNSYPISPRWLRFWLNEYMFTRDAPGFLFLTDDWMSLSREIDVYRDRWRDRKARAAHPTAISMNPFLHR
jgi:hypothetical protein